MKKTEIPSSAVTVEENKTNKSSDGLEESDESSDSVESGESTLEESSKRSKPRKEVRFSPNSRSQKKYQKKKKRDKKERTDDETDNEDGINQEMRERINKILSNEPIVKSLRKKTKKGKKFDRNADLPPKPSEIFKEKRHVILLSSSNEDQPPRKDF